MAFRNRRAVVPGDPRLSVAPVVAGDGALAGAGAALLPHSLTDMDIAGGKLMLCGTFPARTAELRALHAYSGLPDHLFR